MTAAPNLIELLTNFVATEITQILERIANGSEQAFDEMLPLVYDQMRQMAALALRREPSGSCDPTELVHEAYLRLIGNENLAWKNRSHFFAACAVVIRRILVDQARARKRLKRGGQLEQVTLQSNDLAQTTSNVDLIALDEALIQLESLAPRQAKLVELRFFGGLTESEAAEVLQVSRRTVAGDWAMARAWLKSKLD